MMAGQPLQPLLRPGQIARFEAPVAASVRRRLVPFVQNPAHHLGRRLREIGRAEEGGPHAAALQRIEDAHRALYGDRDGLRERDLDAMLPGHVELFGIETQKYHNDCFNDSNPRTFPGDSFRKFNNFRSKNDAAQTYIPPARRKISRKPGYFP